ncbi:MAG: methyltransferase domain-containing protein, partial [Nocardioides sp.]
QVRPDQPLPAQPEHRADGTCVTRRRAGMAGAGRRAARTNETALRTHYAGYETPPSDRTETSMTGDETSQAPWQGALYAENSRHHRTADDWFLSRHRPTPTDVVVDLGCGTGEFAALVASLVPDGHVVGVDHDESMLSVARRHENQNLRFVQAEVERVDEVN